MRLFLFVILAVSGASAQAQDNVECVNASNSVVMLYKAEPREFRFFTLNGIAISKDPQVRAITGAERYRQGLTPDYVVFTYPTSGNTSVEMTWVSGESELLRGIRGRPVSALTKLNGSVTDTFPACKWSARE